MAATDFFFVSECKGQKTIDGEQVPLVLAPSGDDGKSNGYEALVEALKANREWVEAKVVANSGLLLRGFDVRDAAEFNAVVEALGWPDIRYVGPAPRTHVHGRVWTANEGPLEEFIYYHHEMVLVRTGSRQAGISIHRHSLLLLANDGERMCLRIDRSIDH
jgi:hypothetical protein